MGDVGMPSPQYDTAANMITARLGVIAAAPAGAGHFAFDPDGIREIIKGWRELADSYPEAIRDAEVLRRVQPPGNDDPSGFFAAVVQASGEALQQSLTAERTFCLRQLDKFQAALDSYLGVEHKTVDGLARQESGTVF
jgi:hypothetical protein